MAIALDTIEYALGYGMQDCGPGLPHMPVLWQRESVFGQRSRKHPYNCSQDGAAYVECRLFRLSNQNNWHNSQNIYMPNDRRRGRPLICRESIVRIARFAA